VRGEDNVPEAGCGRCVATASVPRCESRAPSSHFRSPWAAQAPANQKRESFGLGRHSTVTWAPDPGSQWLIMQEDRAVRLARR